MLTHFYIKRVYNRNLDGKRLFIVLVRQNWTELLPKFVIFDEIKNLKCRYLAKSLNCIIRNGPFKIFCVCVASQSLQQQYVFLHKYIIIVLHAYI